MTDHEIQAVVQAVVAGLQKSPSVIASDGIFPNMDTAIAAAAEAEKVVRIMSLDHREKVISSIRRKLHENAELLAKLAVEETGMGNVGHKILKNHLTAEKTPGTEDIKTVAWSGDRA